MTPPTTETGRRPEGRRVARLGSASGAPAEWAIRRTEQASAEVAAAGRTGRHGPAGGRAARAEERSDGVAVAERP